MIDPQSSPAQPSRPTRILIAEDERIIARDIKQCLENLGYCVTAIAASGTEAIQSVHQTQPDLVLMDIRLKGDIDGIQAAQQIWEDFSIPIIYATGHSDQSTLQWATLTDPFGYLLKPIEEKELYVAIETALHRYRLERRLHEREQWLSSVLEKIGDGVIVFNVSGQVRYLNPTAEMLTGWTSAEALNQPIANVFRLIDAETKQLVAPAVIRALEDGILVHWSAQTLLVAKDGTERPMSTSTAPLIGEHDTITGAVVVFRQANSPWEQSSLHSEIQPQTLQNRLGEVHQIAQLKEDFLSSVSHELKTPLTSIQMAIQLLEVVLDQHGVLNLGVHSDIERITRYLGILRHQCDRELSLVNNLLDLQKLNANAYMLKPTPLQLQEWVPSILAPFQPRLDQRQLQLDVRINPNLLPLTTDAPSLERILSELIDNACKYTPDGGALCVVIDHVPDIENEPGLSHSNQASMAIQFSMKNTGGELPQDAMNLLFEPFYRLSNGDRWRQSGIGLGLAIVKKLVQLLGGQINATSDSEWTCFTLQLPQHFGQSISQ
jgi:PAS domain S-box-containing protein